MLMMNTLESRKWLFLNNYSNSEGNDKEWQYFCTFHLFQGFTQFTIEGSDDFNGVIGFDADSLYTTINEDTNPSAVLTLDRGVAYFDDVMVS